MNPEYVYDDYKGVSKVMKQYAELSRQLDQATGRFPKLVEAVNDTSQTLAALPVRADTIASTEVIIDRAEYQELERKAALWDKYIIGPQTEQ